MRLRSQCLLAAVLGATGGCTVFIGEGPAARDIIDGGGLSCTSDRDCDPQAFCAGTVVCSQAGFCEPGPGSAAAAGTACGNCGGACTDGGVCWLASCGCLSTLPDGGEGYVINPAIGQVCNDAALSDTTPDTCRTNCQPAHCGDGVVDTGERCDLGAQNGLGLGCNATCNLLGKVTTLAPVSAVFSGNAIALCNGSLYVASDLDSIIQVSLQTGLSATVAGGDDTCSDQDGVGVSATFCRTDVLTPFDGGLLVGDDGKLRFVTCSNPATVTTFAGQHPNGPTTNVDAGAFASASYGITAGITVLGGVIYTDALFTGEILWSDPTTRQVGVLTTVDFGFSTGPVLQGMIVVDGGLFTANQAPTALLSITPLGPSQGQVTMLPGTERLRQPWGLCTDGASLYVIDTLPGQVWQYDLARHSLTALAGGAGGIDQELDGVGIDAGFDSPASCTFDLDAGVLYVGDTEAIRKIE